MSTAGKGIVWTVNTQPCVYGHRCPSALNNLASGEETVGEN